jgi:cell division protein FtsB
VSNRSIVRLLVVVAVLQGLVLVSLWTGSTLPVASAQISDPGAQRIQQLDELKQINVKLDKLMDLLRSGQVQVKTVATDEMKAGQAR